MTIDLQPMVDDESTQSLSIVEPTTEPWRSVDTAFSIKLVDGDGRNIAAVEVVRLPAVLAIDPQRQLHLHSRLTFAAGEWTNLPDYQPIAVLRIREIPSGLVLERVDGSVWNDGRSSITGSLPLIGNIDAVTLTVQKVAPQSGVNSRLSHRKARIVALVVGVMAVGAGVGYQLFKPDFDDLSMASLMAMVSNRAEDEVLITDAAISHQNTVREPQTTTTSTTSARITQAEEPKPASQPPKPRPRKAMQVEAPKKEVASAPKLTKDRQSPSRTKREPAEIQTEPKPNLMDKPKVKAKVVPPAQSASPRTWKEWVAADESLRKSRIRFVRSVQKMRKSGGSVAAMLSQLASVGGLQELHPDLQRAVGNAIRAGWKIRSATTPDNIDSQANREQLRTLRKDFDACMRFNMACDTTAYYAGLDTIVQTASAKATSLQNVNPAEAQKLTSQVRTLLPLRYSGRSRL